MCCQLCLRVPVSKWRAAGEQFVTNDSVTVNISTVIDGGVAGNLFGRHVARRSHTHTESREEHARLRRGGRRSFNRLRNPEIGNNSSCSGQENVFRLDVTVHNAVHVGKCQGAPHVPQDRNDARDRQCGPLQQRFAQ